MNTPTAEYPAGEQMAEELMLNGWEQKRRGLWVAPNGAYYLGPFSGVEGNERDLAS